MPLDPGEISCVPSPSPGNERHSRLIEHQAAKPRTSVRGFRDQDGRGIIRRRALTGGRPFMEAPRSHRERQEKLQGQNAGFSAGSGK